MSTEAPPQQPLLIRHIMPIVAGGAITLLLTIVTDNTLAAHGVLPSAGRPMFDTGPLVLMTVYRAVFATLGCHLAARIAPERTPRLRYALALGALLFGHDPRRGSRTRTTNSTDSTAGTIAMYSSGAMR